MFKKKVKEEEKNNDTPIFESALRKRIKLSIKIGVPVLLVALFAFIVYRVATSDGRQIVFSDEGVAGTYDLMPINPEYDADGDGIMLSDQGLTLVGETDYLSLSFSNKENLFVIKDLKTGETFRSYPEAIYETTLAEGEESDIKNYDDTTETGQFLSSPVFVGYTKSGMDGGYVLGVNQMKHTKTVYFIENGVRLRYEMLELELEFSIEILVEGDELIYKIPANGIIERETLAGEEKDRRPLLTSLSVLPYLGSHRNGQEGYFVSPDGSGALTIFDAPKITNYNEYSKEVYGSDITFETNNKPSFNEFNVSIGAYGIVENIDAEGQNMNQKANSMMTAFIVNGDSSAELKIANPGIRKLPFYSIYFQYNYRDYYKMQLTEGGTQYDMVVADRQLGDVEQRIKISVSEDKKFSYVDTAKVVRDKLIAQWNGRYGIDMSNATVGEADALNLKLFMGAQNQSGGVLNQIKVMTDFADVKDIYNALSEAGAYDVRLSLLGWQNKGYFWNATSKLKPDSSFSDDVELEELLKWAKDNGIVLALDNNTLVVYGDPTNGASFRNSIVKQANTFYLNYFITDNSGIYRKSEYYVMSPKYYDKEVVNNVIANLSEYGASAVDLRHLGNLLYSDYNEENPLFRVQAMDLYTKWLENYSSKFEEVTVYDANAFTVPFVDSILDISVDKSSHVLLDEEVPFIQLVYHGLLDYYSSPVNNQDNERFFLLRSIEYGSLMSYEVTKEKTSELRYTYYNGLYRSEFDDKSDEALKNDIVETYNIVSEAILPYVSLEIVNHYKVDDNYEIYCTEYSDGTLIYVCYEDSEDISGNQVKITVNDQVNGGEVTVNGMDYTIKKGGK